MDGLPGVYQLISTRGSYVYLVTDPVPILIDTGFPGRGKAIVQELQTIGLSV
ncbi:MAG: MBL fold metallo-hydrolase, partial [Sulfobacillus benefaciens]